VQPDHHITTMNNGGKIMSLCVLTWRNIVSRPAILPYQITKITAKIMKTSKIARLYAPPTLILSPMISNIFSIEEIKGYNEREFNKSLQPIPDKTGSG